MSSLVTGCSGFIGTHLVRELLRRGESVVGVDRRRSAELEKLARAYPATALLLRWEDLTHESVCRRAMGSATTIYHLAAQADVRESVRDPARALADDLATTVNILEEAARHKQPPRVVIASSAAVYGAGSREPAIEASAVAAVPLSPYAIHKRSCEHYAEFYRRTRGVSTACLRFFNVYGPGQMNMRAVVPALTRGLLRDETVTIMGDGHQTRDFVYVDDVVAATLLAGASDWTGCANVGTGQITDVWGLAAALERVTGKTLTRIVVPAPEFDVRHSVADIGLIRGMGWKPAVDLKEGLLHTVEYYRGLV